MYKLFYSEEISIYNRTPLMQERHHYMAADYTYEPLAVYQERDRVKIEKAKEKGIDLFIIPCWWDGTSER